MLRPLLGLAMIFGSLLVLSGAFDHMQERVGPTPEPPPPGQGIEEHLLRLDPDDAARLQEIWDASSPEQQERILAVLADLDEAQIEDLVDVLDDLDAQQRDALLEVMEGLAGGGRLDGLTPDQRQSLEAMLDDLDQADAGHLTGLLGAMGRQDPARYLDERTPRPLSSRNAGGITGHSGGDPVPGPDTAGAVAPDRRGEGAVTCYAVFEPYLGCAKRWQVLDRIDAGYALSASPSQWQPVATGSGSGVAYTARFPVVIDSGTVTPIFSAAPDQVVRSFGATGPGQANLVRDGRDVYGIGATASGTYTITLVLVDGSAYRGGIPDVSRAMLPPPPVTDPVLVAQVRPWLEANGYWERDDVGAALRELQAMFQGFEGGAPLPAAREPDFFRAVVDGRQGCCRHFATAFMAAAQSMGVHTRAVHNEGHMFAEVLLPGGWVEVQLGGCGGYELEGTAGRTPAARDTNDALLGGRGGSGRPTGDVRPTETTITHAEARVAKSEPFIVEGRVTTAGDPLPDAAVRLYANQTKHAPGTLLGSAATDGSGNWRVEATFPSGLPPGDYQLVAGHRGTSRGAWYAPSWSDPPITVHSASSIEPAFPAYVGAGEPFKVSARLVDEVGTGVPGELLQLSFGGASQMATTDRSGRAAFHVPAQVPGEVAMRVAYNGSDHLGPSSVEQGITVLDAVFTPSFEQPHRITAEAMWRLEGTVRSGGQPLRGTPFTIVSPWGGANATSDAAGRLEATLAAGTGQAWITIRGPAGPVASIEVWAQEPVGAVVVSPQYAQAGRETVMLRWTGSEPHGIPLQTAGGTVWTDAGGRAEVAVADGVEVTWAETPAYPGGSVAVEAVGLPLVPGDGRLAGHRLAIPFSGPDVTSPDTPLLHLDGRDVPGRWDGDTLRFDLPRDATLPETLAIATGFPGHTVTAGYSVVPAGAGPAWWPAALAVAGVLAALASAWSLRRAWMARARPALSWSAQGRPPGVPLAAAPGQAWRLAVHCTDPRDGRWVPARITWRIGDRHGRVDADASGARIDLPPLEAGRHVLHARVRAPRLARLATTAVLHVGPWADHLVMQYAALEEEAQRRAGRRGMTPHLVAAALDDRDQAALLEAIRCYEAAAFGGRSVGQDDWETFARASLPGGDVAH